VFHSYFSRSFLRNKIIRCGFYASTNLWNLVLFYYYFIVRFYIPHRSLATKRESCEDSIRIIIGPFSGIWYLDLDHFFMQQESEESLRIFSQKNSHSDHVGSLTVSDNIATFYCKSIACILQQYLIVLLYPLLIINSIRQYINNKSGTV
jgi:hypothetical protein